MWKEPAAEGLWWKGKVVFPPNIFSQAMLNLRLSKVGGRGSENGARVAGSFLPSLVRQ